MLLNYQPPTRPYLSVIYQDDDLVVCDKQSGLLSVRGKAPEHQDSLQSRCETVWPQLGIVHRLDMGTSGLMVMALNRFALSELSKQFQQRKTQKTYIANIWGIPKTTSGTIELPLIVDWPNRPKQKVCYQTGKSATTHWQLMQTFEDYSQVKLTPITGRSHQLRVHMAEMGHPILGDKFYASEDALAAAPRLNLHAYQLTLFHPTTRKSMTFTSSVTF